jgi:hypothetical protein
MVLHTRHLIFRLNDVLLRHPSAPLTFIKIPDCPIFTKASELVTEKPKELPVFQIHLALMKTSSWVGWQVIARILSCKRKVNGRLLFPSPSEVEVKQAIHSMLSKGVISWIVVPRNHRGSEIGRIIFEYRLTSAGTGGVRHVKKVSKMGKKRRGLTHRGIYSWKRIVDRKCFPATEIHKFFSKHPGHTEIRFTFGPLRVYEGVFTSSW